MSIPLRVKLATGSGKELLVSVDGDTTAAGLKAKLEGQVGVPATEQRLIFSGRPLDDNRPFSEYDFDENEATLIHLLVLPTKNHASPTEQQQQQQQQQQKNGDDDDSCAPV